MFYILFIVIVDLWNVNKISYHLVHVKAFLNPYNQMEDYIHHMAHYMFVAGCQFENMDQFTKFIGIAASMDWSATPTLDRGNVAK